jgi:outer membrane protein OmpA-like peptidoglycan-associated protein
MTRRAAILAGLLVAGAADAAEIPLPPGAVLAADEATAFSMVPLPTGPWTDGPPPMVDAEGAVVRRAWRVPEGDRTTAQLLAPIRDRLEADGFAVLYSCADRACGGYDFRFGLDLLPAPAMYVDLGDFRYLLAAEDGTAGRRLVSVVTSRGLGAGYVHVTTVDPADAPATAVPLEAARPEAGGLETPAPLPVAPPASDIARRLLSDGHAALDGLEFPSGSAALPGDGYASLSALAAFLEENPSATVVLVGHTDAVGALDANTALSRARAQSVRTRLIGTYGIDPGRLLAEGAGYLAPVASNLTPEGRAANRRVEAVLLAAP